MAFWHRLRWRVEPTLRPGGDSGLEVFKAATRNAYKKKSLHKNKSECKAHDHHTPPETTVGGTEVDQVRAAKRQRAEEPRMADAAEVPPSPVPAGARMAYLQAAVRGE